jgi:hypothetical protein
VHLSRFNLDGAATAGIRALNCTGVITLQRFKVFEKLTLDALRNRIDSSYALIMLYKLGGN